MIRSLGFLGVRTAAFAESAALSRDTLGHEPILERPGAIHEIIGPDRSAA